MLSFIYSILVAWCLCRPPQYVGISRFPKSLARLNQIARICAETITKDITRIGKPLPPTMLETSNDDFITINYIELGGGDELINSPDRYVPRLLSRIVAVLTHNCNVFFVLFQNRFVSNTPTEGLTRQQNYKVTDLENKCKMFCCPMGRGQGKGVPSRNFPPPLSLDVQRSSETGSI